MKNILVIGASSGIGKATSENLINCGHRVWGTYNNTPIDNADKFEKIQHINVLDDFEIDIPEKLDGLVYCPGSINLKPFKRLSEELIYSDWNLHVNGAVKTLQKVLPNLLNSTSASVVMYSTVAVQTGFTFHASVAMSKGAIEGLVRSLAAEFAPTIRFNAIAPSLTKTPLSSSLLNSEAKLDSNSERHPMKRVGEASDIGNLTSFLLSEKSSWMTGQVLHLDGGIGNLK